MLLIACWAVSVSATDLTLFYSDTIQAADTAAATVRVDTVYSLAMDVRGATRLQFAAALAAAVPGEDTNWTADTFFVKLQHSFDKVNWRVMEIDTLLDTGFGWSVLNPATADSVVGWYSRCMLVHWDSLEATGEDIVDRIYKYKASLYINAIY